MSEVPDDAAGTAAERVLAAFFAEGSRCDVAEFDVWAQGRDDLRSDDALRAEVARHVRGWEELQRLISDTSDAGRSNEGRGAASPRAGAALGPCAPESLVGRDGTAEAWISQEVVEDTVSLRTRLQALGRTGLPAGHFGWAADLVARIADGLHAAHEAGVVHADVTPRNVLIAPGGPPRVIGFGLSRDEDDPRDARAGDLAETWGYRSPEQVGARPAELDRRSDVFSLGAVLYELLTLRRPFDGNTTRQIATDIASAEPVDPRRIRSRCPRGLALIAAKALEKRPARRYATAAAFAEDLRRHLREEPTDAREPGWIERARRWVRRRRPRRRPRA
ncbi:MAG: serine/threonine-protein kinase [Planctomycetota bacterium]